MRKVMLFAVAAVCLVGCSAVETHNGRRNVTWQNPDAVRFAPLEAEIQVEQPISGVAECHTWFGFLTTKPERQTYGADISVSSGNFAPNACSRGAIYDALSSNNADVMVGPRYTAVKRGYFCLFGFCMHNVYQIIVNGNKGKIVNYHKAEPKNSPAN